MASVFSGELNSVARWLGRRFLRQDGAIGHEVCRSTKLAVIA